MQATHQVFNQSPILENINFYQIDTVLTEIGDQQDFKWIKDQFDHYGEIAGSQMWLDKAAQANIYNPEFKSHDTKGNRIDEVTFHPAYHEIMSIAATYGLHALPWTTSHHNAHRARLILYYLHAQLEAGTGCPITMTFACVPAIKKYLPQAEALLPKILNNQYDGSNRSFTHKSSMKIGMAMTEKQGGTDVRANTTVATALDQRGSGKVYELTGHKWFCSAPMCDAFLTLAQTEKGLSCFLLPRWKENGEKNHFRIQRLKNKLGNRSNASSEIEFDGAHAWLMGVEGRGVSVIIEMVALTRYDCMIGSAALMRRGLTEVLHHIKYRKVGGQYLVNHPLMRSVVADLCLESEASFMLSYRAAMCLEKSDHPGEQLLLRLLTPIGKYWITKRSMTFLAEAMECLGGNGYTEDNILPRLYREAPVNAIWEGSGNVQCLDVLRAIRKSDQCVEVLLEELKGASDDPAYQQYVSKLKEIVISSLDNESIARVIVESIAKALSAAQLFKFSPSFMAQAYVENRINYSSQLVGLKNEHYNNEILERYSF